MLWDGAPAPTPAGCQPGQQLVHKACSDCAPGYWSTGSRGCECKVCPIGKFGGGIGCVPCSQGKYGTKVGSLEEVHACARCPAGKFGSAAAICARCERGQFLGVSGARGQFPTQCQVCPDGKATTQAGAVDVAQCKWFVCASLPARKMITRFIRRCPRGQYVAGLGTLHTGCFACPATKYFYRPFRGSTDSPCLPCPAGKFQFQTGQTTCSKCPVAKHARPAPGDCTGCPSGKYQHSGSSKSCDWCESGRYSRTDYIDASAPSEPARCKCCENTAEFNGECQPNLNSIDGHR